MNSKIYQIRPLKWKKHFCEGYQSYRADVPMGSYTVSRNKCHEHQEWDAWVLRYSFSEYYDEGEIDGIEGVSDAKKKAYLDWEGRILGALKEIKS